MSDVQSSPSQTSPASMSMLPHTAADPIGTVCCASSIWHVIDEQIEKRIAIEAVLVVVGLLQMLANVGPSRAALTITRTTNVASQMQQAKQSEAIRVAVDRHERAASRLDTVAH